MNIKHIGRLIEPARPWRTATTCAARAHGDRSDWLSTGSGLHRISGQVFGTLGPRWGSCGSIYCSRRLGNSGSRLTSPTAWLARSSREESQVSSSCLVTSQTPTRTEHGLQYSEAEPIITLRLLAHQERSHRFHRAALWHLRHRHVPNMGCSILKPSQS
jgi:hypothetical protein